MSASTKPGDSLVHPSSKCAKCGQPADKKCGGCLSVSYCSAAHQKEHWKEQHRKFCCSYIVKYSDELGRYLVASRDLKERTLVIKESPFTFAPYDQEDGIPMCLGCCSRISANDHKRSSRRCSTCGWPICSKECEQFPAHRDNECRILESKKVPYPPPERKAVYSSILILRLLLQKEKQPELWSAFLQMEHHTKLRMQKESCNTDDRMILNNLRHYLGECDVNEQEIREIIGRVSVNSFGVTRQEEEQKDLTVGRGVYLKAGIVAHSCVPNAVWGISYSPNFQILVRTSVPIKKGETITPTYSDIWNSLGTYHRLTAMFERSHFICKCQRCTDPTELGTFISAVKCPNCPQGYLLPVNPVDLNSLAVWKCRECGAGDTQQTVVNLVDEIQWDVEQTVGELKEEEGQHGAAKLERLFEQYCGKVLHKNHFVIRSLEKAIVEKLYPVLESCSIAELDRFLLHCRNLLKVNDVLSPGYTGNGGVLRSYLRDGLEQKNKKTLAAETVKAVFGSTKEYNKCLREIEELKREAALHLENDPDATPSH